MENGSQKVENGNRKREVAWHLSATVAKREAQMAASSEHEFGGRVSGELSGEIFG